METVLLEKTQGTFLWVSLLLSSLEQRRLLTLSDLQGIEVLPLELASLYQKLLLDIPLADRDMAAAVLRVIVISRRPLHTDEITILLSNETQFGRMRDLTLFRLCSTPSSAQ